MMDALGGFHAVNIRIGTNPGEYPTIESIVYPLGLENGLNPDLDPNMFGHHDPLTLSVEVNGKQKEKTWDANIYAFFDYLSEQYPEVVGETPSDMLTGRINIPINFGQPLTHDAIGLPWDIEDAFAQGIWVQYRACNTRNDTHFHFGDLLETRLNGEQTIRVLAPVTGYVYKMKMHNDGSGANLMIQTPYFHNGMQVNFQVRHHDTYSIKEGDYIFKGMQIGTQIPQSKGGATNPGDRNIIDWSAYIGPIEYEDQTVYDNHWEIDHEPFTRQDLLPYINNQLYSEGKGCVGNPINK
jgi:hypothetical protein